MQQIMVFRAMAKIVVKMHNRCFFVRGSLGAELLGSCTAS